MATILEEENEQQNQGQQPQTGGGQQPSTGGGVTMPGSQAPSYQPEQKGSGRFTNIRKYIGANQPAGQQLVGRIQKEGDEAANRVREGIEASRNRFGEQESGIRQGVEAGREAAQSAFQSPTAITDDQRQRFGQLYGGQLGQQAQEIDASASDVQRQAQGIQQMADQAGTEQGRFGLLRQTFARPGERYTLGQQRLDELFLQGTPAAGQLGQQLGSLSQQIGQETQSLQDELGTRQQALADLVGTERTAAENLLLRGSEEGLEESLGQRGLEDISQSLIDRLAQTQADAPEQYNLVKQALESNVPGDLQDPILDQLREIAGPAGNIYNIDLNKYLPSEEAFTGRLGTATADQLATQEEFQRFQNIAGLLGREGLGITEDQAGTFDPYQLDRDQLTQDLADKQQTVENYQQEFAQGLADQIQATQNEMMGMRGSNNFYVRELYRSLIPEQQRLNQAYTNYQQNPNSETFGNLVNELNTNNVFRYGSRGRRQPEAERNIARELEQLNQFKRLFGDEIMNPNKLAGIGGGDPSIMDPSQGKG